MAGETRVMTSAEMIRRLSEAKEREGSRPLPKGLRGPSLDRKDQLRALSATLPAPSNHALSSAAPGAGRPPVIQPLAALPGATFPGPPLQMTLPVPSSLAQPPATTQAPPSGLPAGGAASGFLSRMGPPYRK
eukprot:TRINITY_DN21621_c0_g1_i1.p2 TRINITY_DN21621_c0_g1~~TRINITY_DN21621_c0_g1_i1.p2  ORF type:complete len:132 (+),score=19.92 TRINITY_DN21621_c0_g1_i1:152-547(+)